MQAITNNHVYFLQVRELRSSMFFVPCSVIQSRNVNQHNVSGFGGLKVCVLASGTRVRGFKHGRSCRIFRAKKSSARLPSEGK